MSSGKWWPLCPGFNVLTIVLHDIYISRQAYTILCCIVSSLGDFVGQNVTKYFKWTFFHVGSCCHVQAKGYMIIWKKIFKNVGISIYKTTSAIVYTDK